jgi:hypothetical protein
MSAASPAEVAQRRRAGRWGLSNITSRRESWPEQVRTFARTAASLIEEAQAIGWYEQRMAVETDVAARAVMANSEKEEFKHFGMDLELLLRRKPEWRTELKEILFTRGDSADRGEKAEKKVD